jgi:hypothetical protein
MPRKLTAAEHLQSYRVDVSAGKVESGARRRIPYGDGLYLFITGPRSCRWRYDYRHRGVLTSSFWPAIGEAALGEKEAKAERSKLWLANYEERQQALKARREARRRTRLGLPAIPAKPVPLLPAGPAPTAPAPGAIMTFGQAWERYARAQRGGWDSAKRNGRTEKRYRGLVARYCSLILDMPVTEITVDDVAAVLNNKTSRGTPLWRGSDSDGHKLRVFIESALDLAVSNRTPLHLRPNCANCCPRTPTAMAARVTLGSILTTCQPSCANLSPWAMMSMLVFSAGKSTPRHGRRRRAKPAGRRSTSKLGRGPCRVRKRRRVNARSSSISAMPPSLPSGSRARPGLFSVSPRILASTGARLA